MMEKISDNYAVKKLSVSEAITRLSKVERFRKTQEEHDGSQMFLQFHAMLNGVDPNSIEDYEINDADSISLTIDLNNIDVKVKPTPKVRAFAPYEGEMDLKLIEFNTETAQAKCQIYKAQNINPPSSAKFTFVNLETELVFTVISRMFPTVRVFVVKENVATIDIYQIQKIVGIDGEKVKADLFVDNICDACPISKQIVIDNIGFSKKIV